MSYCRYHKEDPLSSKQGSRSWGRPVTLHNDIGTFQLRLPTAGFWRMCPTPRGLPAEQRFNQIRDSRDRTERSESKSRIKAPRPLEGVPIQLSSQSVTDQGPRPRGWTDEELRTGGTAASCICFLKL